MVIQLSLNGLSRLGYWSSWKTNKKAVHHSSPISQKGLCASEFLSSWGYSWQWEPADYYSLCRMLSFWPTFVMASLTRTAPPSASTHQKRENRGDSTCFDSRAFLASTLLSHLRLWFRLSSRLWLHLWPPGARRSQNGFPLVESATWVGTAFHSRTKSGSQPPNDFKRKHWLIFSLLAPSCSSGLLCSIKHHVEVLPLCKLKLEDNSRSIRH